MSKKTTDRPTAMEGNKNAQKGRSPMTGASRSG